MRRLPYSEKGEKITQKTTHEKNHKYITHVPKTEQSLQVCSVIYVTI